MNKEAWFKVTKKYEIFVKFFYTKIPFERVILIGK